MMAPSSCEAFVSFDSRLFARLADAFLDTLTRKSYKPCYSISVSFFAGGSMNIYRRTTATLFLSALLLAVSPQLARGNGFTLEQVLGAPFPSGMVASAKGDKVAWVFLDHGKRNIFLAEAPAFKGRQLTRYNQDDGQEVTSLVFSPDGAWIAYVRGGPQNSDRESPNP